MAYADTISQLEVSLGRDPESGQWIFPHVMLDLDHYRCRLKHDSFIGHDIIIVLAQSVADATAQANQYQNDNSPGLPQVYRDADMLEVGFAFAGSTDTSSTAYHDLLWMGRWDGNMRGLTMLHYYQKCNNPPVESCGVACVDDVIAFLGSRTKQPPEPLCSVPRKLQRTTTGPSITETAAQCHRWLVVLEYDNEVDPPSGGTKRLAAVQADHGHQAIARVIRASPENTSIRHLSVCPWPYHYGVQHDDVQDGPWRLPLMRCGMYDHMSYYA